MNVNALHLRLVHFAISFMLLNALLNIYIYIYIVPRHQFVPFVPCGWFVSRHFAEMTLFPVPGKIQQPTSNNDNREQQQQQKKNHAVKEKRATELRLSEWRRPHRAHANTHRHTFGDTTKAEKAATNDSSSPKRRTVTIFIFLKKKSGSIVGHCTLHTKTHLFIA